MSNESNTLREFLAVPVEIPIGKASIKVQPMGWFDAIAAIDLIAPALESMPALPEKTADGQSVAGASVMEWLHWVALNRGAVLGFCRVATNQDEAVIAGLPPTALVELLIGLFEVNADFFVESLPGLLARAGARTEALVQRIQVAMTRQAQSSTTSNG